MMPELPPPQTLNAISAIYTFQLPLSGSVQWLLAKKFSNVCLKHILREFENNIIIVGIIVIIINVSLEVHKMQL